MTDQTQRLEIATVRAEVGSNILSRFSNDALEADEIPTDSGPIINLKQIIKSVEDKASVSTSIYTTEADGLAATEEGGMFLVQSDEDDEIYVVWRKVAGVAVDTGKRALSSQAAANAVNAAQSSAEAAEISAIAAEESAEIAAAEFLNINDHINPLNGAGRVGRATRQINSVAELRTVTGRYDMDQCSLVGYHAAFNGYGGGPVYWSASSTDADDGFSTFAVAGIPNGRWKRLNMDDVTVFHAGAIQGGESSDAIQRAINWVKTRGWGTVDFGKSSFFLLNKPLRGTYECHYKGKAIIRAQAPFGNLAVDLFTGGITAIASLIFFCDVAPTSSSGTVATLYNPTGSRRTNIVMDPGLTWGCRGIADYGIFTDNYQYLFIHSRVRDALKYGIRLNFYGWTGHVSSRITGSAEGGIWIGAGCNGMNFAGLMTFGDTKVSSVAGILIDGDNNGLSLAGAAIELARVGVLARNGCGPVSIAGVDIEKCVDHVIEADGSGAPARINGPIKVSSTFLEVTSATTAIIKATNSIVEVSKCRVRNAAKFIEHTGGGYVVEADNVKQSTLLSLGAGRIYSKNLEGRSIADHWYSPVSSTMQSVRETYNHAYPYDAAARTSGCTYLHQVVSDSGQTMSSQSTWFVANYSGGSEIGRIGITLDYAGGSPAVIPLSDNVQDLGSASRRHKVVYAGTGAINTSDAREKTNVRRLTVDEVSAAKSLGQEVGAYKWLASVAEKGDEARDHIGMTVQRAIEIMEEHGLDPFGYGFICYDKWEEETIAVPAVYDQIELECGGSRDGEMLKPEGVSVVLEAGDRYSFRYDELNLFIAAGFEARLSALEDK